MNNDIIQFIKSQWDCITYANSVLGCPVHKPGDRCVSPLRTEAKNPTSFIVFHDNWRDFGGDTYGDVIDLCALARHNGNISEALKELAGDYFNNIGSDWKKFSDDLQKKISYWHSQLRPQDKDYLHSRRINDDTIERLKIGWRSFDNRLTFPYFKNGRVVYYASRDRSGAKDAPKYKKAPINEYNDHVPWGLHSLTQDFSKLHGDFISDSDGNRLYFKKTLCILEGAFDVFSFEQEGFHVLSPIGGYFNKYQLTYFLAAAKNHEQVFICFDNDKSGQKFQKRMSEFCFAHHIKFICGHVPPQYKDVSDFYTDGGNVADLVSNATNGLATLARTFTEKEDFANFLLSVARFAYKADIMDLCLAAPQFPGSWLKALYEDCSKPPREKLLVDEISKKYTLKYIVNNGFFEYLHGVYVKQPDEFVKKYIAEALGLYATSSRINNVCGFLKTHLASQDEFNKQNIFNFINGVLDLDTCKLIPHAPGILSSVQARYVYDEKASCPLWKKFLSQVMEDNPLKMLLLQQIAGYVLFPDCRHEKAFMLLGEGSNGKSVFINTLEHVFGKENCSNVTISDLMSPFDPIRLQSSIVNFSTEMKSNVKGAEDKFKQVVSGEAITAAYKGKDAITFSPRGKWIFAANNFIASNDITHGFTRRIVFVKFPHTFSDSEVDRELPKKLQAEIPGIFNWVLQGYKNLLEAGDFVRTPEDTELKNEFLTSINPLIVFTDEKLIDITAEKLTAQELYTRYVEWCKSSGHTPLSRINFTRNLRVILEKKRPDVVYKRSGAETFFVFGAPVGNFEY